MDVRVLEHQTEAIQGVISLNNWETIRLRCVRDKEPIKRVARELGISPHTVRKYIESSNPPIKITIDRPSILDMYKTAIDSLLQSTPKITAARIHTILVRDYDSMLSISESTARKYVAQRRKLLVPKEAFVRAEYIPGVQAQFDFSPMRATINGVENRVEVFVMRLSYSGHFYAYASKREDLPALMFNIIEALKFFDGIPSTAIFDNAKTAVTHVLRGRGRIENESFLAFRGALALEVEYAAPRRGNEKGGVEGTHGFIEDNFFRPLPAFSSLTSLNAALRQFCIRNLKRRHSTHRETIGERYEREKVALRPLPEHYPSTCVTTYAKINKFAEVTIKSNRYSVPTKYAFRDAFIELGNDNVRICVGSLVVAEHPRADGRREAIINPLHSLDLIARKHRSALSAAAFSQGRLPVCLVRLRDQLIARDGIRATKSWTEILLLAVNTSLDQLARAVDCALARGTIDIEAIKLLVHQKPHHIIQAPIIPDSATSAVRAQVISLEGYRMQRFTEQCS